MGLLELTRCLICPISPEKKSAGNCRANLKRELVAQLKNLKTNMKKRTLRKRLVSGACLLAAAAQGNAATAGFGLNLVQNGQAETPPPADSRTPNAIVTGW